MTAAADIIAKALRDAQVPQDTPTTLATVTGGTSTTLTVQFDGESTPSIRGYARCFGPAAVGDRVVMLRSGSTWIAICRLPTTAKPFDSGWITATLAAGWNHFDARSVQYRRLNGVVYLRGICKDGAGLIFGLPADFRPETRVFVDNYFPVASNGVPGVVSVDGGSGGVALVNGSPIWVDLCSISFLAHPH